MLFVSISVYAVDTFTAINLLAFNKWAGQIKPEVPLKYSRWIFAGCIIFSFVLLIYRWIRALKVMRGGKVAKSYLDPLAVRVECIRMGQEGRGWKRFLVFAELTKSRKGADYVALFAYYSFEAWLRITIAEGPRVVINGITLYAYAEANIIPTGAHAAPQGQSPFVQFWANFGLLAEQDKLQFAIICGMIWTCLIWIISALSLLISIILYFIFLWHHIPSDAGGLSKYCRTKVNRRMERIVKVKTDKALKKENELRARQEAQAIRDGRADIKRQPTLPDVAGASLSSMPALSRQTTMSTLPEYSSRPGTAAPPEDALPAMPTLPALPPVDTNPRPNMRRHMTNASDASWASYNSEAPLINSASEYGHSPADRMQTPLSTMSTPWSARPTNDPRRNFTDFPQQSDRSFTPGPPRPGTSHSQRGTSISYQMEPLQRPGTSMSQRSRPIRGSSDSDSGSHVPRGMTPVSASSTHAPSFPEPQRMRTPANNNYNPYFPPVSPIPESPGFPPNGASRPYTPDEPYRSHTPVGPPPRMTLGHAPSLPRLQTASPAPGTGYLPFNPGRDRTQSPASAQPYTAFNSNMERTQSPAPAQQYRSYTPVGNDSYRAYSAGPERHATPANDRLQPPKPDAPPRAGSFDDILDHY